MRDNLSFRTRTGDKVNTGLPFIVLLFRLLVLLITFPFRVFWFFINPLPDRKGTPKQIKIRK
jgi:hypothetical protein